MDGILFYHDQFPKTLEEKELMKVICYASTMGSLMYAMLCTKSDIYNVVGIVNIY